MNHEARNCYLAIQLFKNMLIYAITPIIKDNQKMCIRS